MALHTLPLFLGPCAEKLVRGPWEAHAMQPVLLIPGSMLAAMLVRCYARGRALFQRIY